MDLIKIRGARQHNLKNIDLDIPKNQLVIFTGVSGSGKSSLAFDTIYAEGQRRYVESLSAYARQFLGIMDKPDVDTIEGLSPAISIDQKTTSRNPRSTVGTVTEIYDYLRLLYARIGHPHCPICGREIRSQSADEIVIQIFEFIKKSLINNKVARFAILTPLVNGKKGEFANLFENLKAQGFKQVRVDNHTKVLSSDFILIKTNKHNIEGFVDKLSVSDKDMRSQIFVDNLKSRLTDSVEQALKLSDGLVILSEINDKSLIMPEFPKEFTDHLFSEKFSCPIDNISLPEIEPRTFSFNTPHGACPRCSGIGRIQVIDSELVFSPEISITEGGILPFANTFEHDSWLSRLILTFCYENNIDPRVPIKDLSEDNINLILNGTNEREYKVEGTNRFGKMTYIYEKFTGVIQELENRYQATDSDWARHEIEKYMRDKICPECLGARLKKEALAITIYSLPISSVTGFSIEDIFEWIKEILKHNILSIREKKIAEIIIKEISERLSFLISVGLNYLTLDRSASTLSGGEAQRIRLASQIGSGLTGILYVLDEPTIGLHQRDNQKLIMTLKKLRDLGNSVLVVEHDPQTIKESDYIFDFGPGAGKNGGEVIAKGTPEEITNNKKSITGAYLSGRRKIETNINDLQSKVNMQYLLKQPVNELNGKFITINGCSQYNLKNVDVKFPLGKFVVITGVSGSGKSTLLVETLYPALETYVNKEYKGSPGAYKNLEGVENINKVILIDQSPIGRTPRSNPATYTKVFDHIRDVFTQTREARSRGYNKGRFSFNVKGGRCEACEGQGQTKIEMQFMSDIWITCDVCKGTRYNSQTLEVTYKGKNIAEVLQMNITEALEFFHAHTPIITKLETIIDVGLDYMELGQPATTLSGGEAQRIKLASELSKKDTGSTVYVLDEPTTGLHFADVEKLLRVLKLLVKKGNSVFVIEHNLDVIKNADWIIDLGPEGGEQGGKIVGQGNVQDIILNEDSYTGNYLKQELGYT
jgi:excinuclease ABC subunit A